jgi:pyrroloquinoline quinone biosynthesis protein B
MALTAVVLGSAAGGGFPQWNCRCAVCRLAWDGDLRVKRRTQTSLAVSVDGQHWSLLNAAPDLRAQIGATRALQPREGTRSSPIEAVVLTGGEIDQTAGLLNLREQQKFALYATAETLGFVDANPMFGALAPGVVARHRVALGDRFMLPGGIEAELFPVPGKLPLYLEGEAPQTDLTSAANVGIALTAASARICFVPGCAAVTPELRQRLAGCDVLFFDATLSVDDEMIRTGTGTKTGRRMGHMPIEGAEGSLAALDGIAARRIYLHINNTNPILVADSPERRRVEAAGWEVADDGMEVVVA